MDRFASKVLHGKMKTTVRQSHWARCSLRWEMAVIIEMALVLPGMKYFFPLGDLFWFKAYLTLVGLWLLRCILYGQPWVGRSAWQRLGSAALTMSTFVILSQALLFFGAILTVFYRWIWIPLAAGGTVFILTFWRGDRPRSRVIAVSLLWIPLAGMAASLWNFNMVGAGRFDPQNNPPAVRAVLTVEQIKLADSALGEAHPYALAYDESSDTLVASFKDDWGAVFPRADRRRHNFLAAFSTRGEDRRLRTLIFGPTQIPENISLRPRERRGWVDVLDMQRRTFHVAAFRYNDQALTLTAFGDLPIEPNAIFDDPERDRLLVVGIQMELLELDPESLAVRSRTNLEPFPRTDYENPLKLFWSSGLSVWSSRFDPRTGKLFFGGLGHSLHSMTLPDLADRPAPVFPIVVGLAIDEQGMLFAAQPLQKKILGLNAETMRTMEVIDVRLPVRAFASIPGTNLVLAGSYSQNRTLAVDRATGAIIAEFHLGRLQREAISDRLGHRVFVASGLGIFEIDGDRL